MPPFGGQPPPEYLKARWRQGDVESQDRQAVLLGCREYSRVIPNNSRVSPAASQPLHNLPDWVRSSIRVEAVDRLVCICREPSVSCKE
jgi:hypothetical protein